MSSSGDRGSRLPLSTVHRSNVPSSAGTAMQIASKIKRRSIGISNGTAAKQPRISAPTPSCSTSIRPPPSTNRVPNGRGSSHTSVSLPLPARHMTGRATAIPMRTTANTPSNKFPLRDRSQSATRGAVKESAQERKTRELEEELKQLRSEREKERTTVKSQEEEIKRLNSQMQDQSKEFMTQITNVLASTQAECGSIRAQLAVSEMCQKATEARLNDVLNKCAVLEEEKAACNRKVEEHKKEVIVKDDEVRRMHNMVVDLKGQIRVAIRVRPPLLSDADKSLNHFSFPDESSVSLDMGGGKAVNLSFNNVFGPNFSQARLFENVQELISSALHGYNVSIIAYGQTGSGKTYTMRGGDGDAAGVIPRAVQFLFHNRHNLEDLDWQFSFSASFFEVYNDEVYDLLSNPPRAKCEVQTGSGRTVLIGLTRTPLESEGTMESLLAHSDRNRSTAATKCNEMSSRSHAIFALHIKGTNSSTGAIVDSTLNLVDLAGSERAKESGVEGERFTEMTHINSALSALQGVIRAILLKHSHVPYRNSKLTRILQDSLGGGKSKCMVLVALNPALSNISESRRSLEFARDMGRTYIGIARKREA